MARPKVHFVGSSHATRLANEAKKIPLLKDFDIVAHTRPGATFHGLTLDPKLFSVSDTVIAQLFGNNLFKKRSIHRVKHPRKVIHLCKFDPQDKNIVEAEMRAFETFVQQIPCKVLLIDNPHRHLRCCDAHHDPRIVKYQQHQNAQLQQFFQSNPKVNVINHFWLLPGTRKNKKNNNFYASLLPDQVHFESHIYRAMLIKIKENFWPL